MVRKSGQSLPPHEVRWERGRRRGQRGNASGKMLEAGDNRAQIDIRMIERASGAEDDHLPSKSKLVEGVSPHLLLF